MKNTYLFYDLETTGLNPCFDQVMQFAAIRTDLEFNEIERHEFYVRLNPDVIPSPYAQITHHIALADVKDGITEIAAMRKIHALINTPGTISVGYNTLGFDDEFLRFSFYRNLLTPYTHQYANSCGRMDIYPITLLYFLYANDTLKWPSRDGKLSMKLENLSHENNLAVGQAHNALVDVEATVALAKLLATRTPMWEYACGYFNKQTDLARLHKLDPEINIILQGKLGIKNNYQALVHPVGQHTHYKNQTLWLRLDHIDFSDIPAGDLFEKTFCIKKRAAEPPIILPPSDRYLEKFKEKRITLAKKNIAWLKEHPSEAQALFDAHKDFKFPVIKGVDIDAALYQSEFASRADQKLCARFHQSKDTDKPYIADQFSDTLYQKIATRLIGRYWEELLNDQQKNEYKNYIDAIHNATADTARHDYREQKQLTRHECQELIIAIKKERSLTEHQERLLDELNAFLEKIS
jgi:exodeoxyribonuclease I